MNEHLLLIPLPSLHYYLHVFAAVACDRMMSPDGEQSGFIVISRNSNVAMPVAHRARLPPPLSSPSSLDALSASLFELCSPRPPLPRAPSEQRRTQEVRTYASERVGGFWRASVRPAASVRPSNASPRRRPIAVCQRQRGHFSCEPPPASLIPSIATELLWIMSEVGHLPMQSPRPNEIVRYHIFLLLCCNEADQTSDNIAFTYDGNLASRRRR